MSRKTRITSSTNHKSFAAPSHTHCNTTNVVYLLECTKGLRKETNTMVKLKDQCLKDWLATGQLVKLKFPTNLQFFSQPYHNFEAHLTITKLEKPPQTFCLIKRAAR